MHEEADREARLYTGRGIHEVRGPAMNLHGANCSLTSRTSQAAAGTPQFPAQLPHPSHVFGASWAHSQQSRRDPVSSKGTPPPPPNDAALFPPLLVWPTLADAGYGASAPATQEGRSLVAALERKALTELFTATGGPSWRRPFRAKWTTSAPHCTWAGVTCMPAQPRGPGGGDVFGNDASGEAEVGVVSIRLRGGGLSGSLPPSLVTLQALQLLEFADNGELRGTLPAGLLALPRMRVVAVKGCRLGGSLPTQLSPSLAWLDVSMNQLGGQLPVRARACCELPWCVSSNTSNLRRRWAI